MEQPRATRSAMKASREVVVEDGFKYKRRKSGATQGGRQSGGAGRVPVAPPAVARGSRKSVNLDELGARSSLPADYPGLTIHENVPEDLPEEERLQQLVEEICEAECRVERERLIREFGSADGAAMAASLEAAMSEFQLKVEELIVRGDVQFDASTTALREMRDAKEEAMRAVATQLEDESAQWSALEDAVRSGSSPEDDASLAATREGRGGGGRGGQSASRRGVGGGGRGGARGSGAQRGGGETTAGDAGGGTERHGGGCGGALRARLNAPPRSSPRRSPNTISGDCRTSIRLKTSSRVWWRRGNEA